MKTYIQEYLEKHRFEMIDPILEGLELNFVTDLKFKHKL